VPSTDVQETPPPLCVFPPSFIGVLNQSMVGPRSCHLKLCPAFARLTFFPAWILLPGIFVRKKSGVACSIASKVSARVSTMFIPYLIKMVTGFRDLKSPLNPVVVLRLSRSSFSESNLSSLPTNTGGFSYSFTGKWM